MRATARPAHGTLLPLGLAVLLAVVGSPDLRAQALPGDAVQALRRTLRAPVRDVARRQRELQRRLAALQSARDLHLALDLQEWRDVDPDEAIAAVDRPLRTALADRLTTDVRTALKGSPAAQQAAATLLAEMGVRVRGVEPGTSFASAFGPELAAAAASHDPAVRRAALHALGLIHPRAEVVAPVLDRALHDASPMVRQTAAAALTDLVQVAFQLASRRNSALGIDGSWADFVQVACAVVCLASGILSDPVSEVRLGGVKALTQAAAGLSWQVGTSRPPETANLAEYQEIQDQERKLMAPLLRALREQTQALGNALHDPDQDIRRQASRALAELAAAEKVLLDTQRRDAPARP